MLRCAVRSVEYPKDSPPSSRALCTAIIAWIYDFHSVWKDTDALHRRLDHEKKYLYISKPLKVFGLVPHTFRTHRQLHHD